MKLVVVRTSDRWGMRPWLHDVPPLPGCVRQESEWVLDVVSIQDIVALSTWDTPVILRPKVRDSSEYVIEVYDDYRES